MPSKRNQGPFPARGSLGPSAASVAAALGLIACTAQTSKVHAAQPKPATISRASTVRLEELTWTELRDAIRAGKKTVIIPVGGLEQSGPTIALGKHDVRVAALSDQIARELHNTLVAPVLAYVPEGELKPPTEHMRFPGTITAPREAFRAVVRSAAESLALHGFQTVALLGDHGGYQSDLKAVADDLNRSWGAKGPRAVYVGGYYRASQTAYVQALQQNRFSLAEIGTHAGLADASLMLAVDPRYVRIDKMRSLSPSVADGVHGDPRRATAELGIVGVKLMIEKAVQQIRAAQAGR